MKWQQFVVMGLTVFLLSATGWARGVLIKTEETGQKPEDNESVTMFLGEENLKIEVRTPKSHQVVIFLGGASKMQVADLRKRTYMEITEEDLQKMKAMHQQAMSQYDQMMKNMPPEAQERMKTAMEQLKNLPPEQQEMAKKYMNLPTETPEEPDKTVYKLVNANASYNNWKCRKYEGIRKGQKVEEILATDFSELGLSSSDFQAFQRMSEFFATLGDMGEEMAPRFNIGSEEWEKEQGYNGVPVKIVSYANGQPVSTMVTKEVAKRDFTPDDFRLPDGLTLENPMKQMRGDMQ